MFCTIDYHQYDLYYVDLKKKKEKYDNTGKYLRTNLDM